MSNPVDGVIDDVKKHMKLLLSSMRGIPHRSSEFRAKYDQLARDIALVVVELDSARGVIKK